MSQLHVTRVSEKRMQRYRNIKNRIENEKLNNDLLRSKANCQSSTRKENP